MTPSTLNKPFGAHLIFSVLIFLTSYFGYAQAADLVQFQGNAQHTGLSPYTGPSSSDVIEKWVLPIDVKEGDPSVTADGSIYVTSAAGILYALNADGSEKWNLNIGTPSRGAPAIGSNGNIHVAGEDGYLYAVSSSGTLLWTFKTKIGVTFGEGFIGGSPAIGDDGTIYVAGVYGDVNALDPNGNLLWTADIYNYNGGFEHFWGTSPTIGINGNLYIQSSDPINATKKGYLFAFNIQTGALAWAMPIGEGDWSTPTVGDNGTIYVGGQWEDAAGVITANYYAIQDNGASADILWSFPISEVGGITSAAMAPDGNAVYFTSILQGTNDYNLFKVDATTGSEVWRYQPMTFGNIYTSTPLVGANGTVYIGTGNGEVGTQNSVHALSAAGVKLWTYDTGAVIWDSPTLGPDGTLYVGSDQLHALIEFVAP